MNSCNFLGRLTKDVQLTFAQGTGTAIAKFTIAVNRIKKDDPADFLNIVAFGKQAETIANSFAKGSRILVQTRVQTGSYDHKDGYKVYTTDFILEKFNFIDCKKDAQGSFQYDQPINPFGTQSYGEDITPVDDEDIPF